MSENSTRPVIDATHKKAYEGPSMLPGMAVIAFFMLFLGMVNAFHAMRDIAARPSARYAVLTVSMLIVVGAFGFLRLHRWGWAMLSAGTLFYSIGNILQFLQSKLPGYLLPAAFSMVFFLYLIRNDVRVRLR